MHSWGLGSIRGREIVKPQGSRVPRAEGAHQLPQLAAVNHLVPFSLIHHRQQRLVVQIPPQIFREQRVMPLP
jgi:hypothetical protein